MNKKPGIEAIVAEASQRLKQAKLARPGDKLVILASSATSNSVNLIKVHIVEK